MGLIETLTIEQKNLLIKTRNEYIEYIKKHGESKFLIDRINQIDEELVPKEKSMPLRTFD